MDIFVELLRMTAIHLTTFKTPYFAMPDHVDLNVIDVLTTLDNNNELNHVNQQADREKNSFEGKSSLYKLQEKVK